MAYKTRLIALCFFSISYLAEAHEGARVIDYFGYSDSIELKNTTTRVIITPSVGGKVMGYALNENESLMIDDAEKGFIYSPEKKTRFFSSGGRFDIGLSKILPQHPVLWIGKWDGEITGDYQAKVISQVDPATGLQIVREFQLSPHSSKLTIKHTMKNVAKEIITAHFWTRTFAKGGGIFISPMTPPATYPLGYVTAEPNTVNIIPKEDKAIYKKDNYLLVVDQPLLPKMGIENFSGWFAYLLQNDLLMLREYDVYPERNYTDIQGGTLSLFYNTHFVGHSVAELEPTGPKEILAKGKSASFTETWHLLTYKFPQDRHRFDIPKFEDTVRSYVKLPHR